MGVACDPIAVSIYSVGPSIRPICTRCCFTITNIIQARDNFHRARVFIITTRPGEIGSKEEGVARTTFFFFFFFVLSLLSLNWDLGLGLRVQELGVRLWDLGFTVLVFFSRRI